MIVLTGIILKGFPDQTYDIWSATGVSAYCGGLWIAACSAMAEMAQFLDDSLTYTKYIDICTKAKEVYNKELWNSELGYYNYDNSVSVHHDSIMADMLAGQWYSRVCQLEPVVPHENAIRSYKTIFDNNVKAST